MSIDLLTSAFFLSIMLAPATVPVCTRALYIASLRFNAGQRQDLALPEPELESALLYGTAMATLPVSGVGICLATFDILRALKIYHAPPLAIVVASLMAIIAAGFGYATVLTAILPVTYRQAVAIQDRITGFLIAIFVPFWSACLL